MRIAVWHDLPSGGGKRALYDHISGLVALGHSVTSWCTPSADQVVLPLSNLVAEHIVPMTAVASKPVGRVLRRLSNGVTSTYAMLKALDDHVRVCADEINRAGVDVVLVGSSQAVGAPPIGRYLSEPSALYLQEPYRPLYEASPRLPWPAMARGKDGASYPLLRLRDAGLVRARRVQAREELSNAMSYDRILANSYFSRESVIRAYGLEAKVCYLGVDTVRYHDQGLDREPLVVGIGEFVSYKRQDVVIRAVAALPTPRPTLVWIGNRADRVYLGNLQALANDLDVQFEPRVSISHDEVVTILNRASVLAYAPRLEPFGYAPLEAAACGVPVVARAEGGVRESVVNGKTGFLVDEDEGLAPAIQRLLEDPPRAAEFRAAARKHVEENWSLEQAVHRLESHLHDVAFKR